MTRPQNPYIAGNPISDQDRFIGRADVMRETLRVLRNPNANAMVLYGQRRIGKTSILLQLEKDLTGDEYCPVYFDLQDKAAMLLGDVLYQLAQTIAKTTTTGLPNRSHFDNEGNFFSTEFLPTAAAQAAPRTLVLLFDEFDVLDLPQKGQASSAFFPYLRKWITQAQSVTFVFVLGRRPEELSPDTLSTLKGTQSHRVSLISQSETVEIVRLSEKNQTLYWTNEALADIWQWTQGHPYFTQLLCSEVWEAAYDNEPAKLPTVQAGDVAEAITDALEQGANALHWIWNGLPVPERIVMAAMAEEPLEKISQERLSEILNHSGVQLILRELKLAPETLVQWDLIRHVRETMPGDSALQNATYRFTIPLLKRWVSENKPLRRVKAELDAIEPLAVNLHQSAQGIYAMGDLEEAERLLMRALDVNPNHMQSRMLLGRVKLGLGKPVAAVAILEPLYAFDPDLARQDYIASLLAQASEQPDHQRAIYNRILEVEPEQAVARNGINTILKKDALTLIEVEDYDGALQIYQRLGDEGAIEQVLTLKRKAKLTSLVNKAEEHEKKERWTEAVDIYLDLLSYFPEENDWGKYLSRAREEIELAALYVQALGSIQEKHTEKAIQLLVQIISLRPRYKDSTQYLLMIITGDDVKHLKSQLDLVSHQKEKLQYELDTATEQIILQQAKIIELEQELAVLRYPSLAEDSVEILRANWDEFKRLVREQNGVRIQAALASVRNIAVADHTVSFAFGNNQFSREIVAEPKISCSIEEILSTILGVPVTLDCQLGERAVVSSNVKKNDAIDYGVLLIAYAIKNLGAKLIKSEKI